MKKNCKTIIKAISLLLIILCFVPSFAVACSGEKMNVSAMGAMGGYSSKDYGVISSPQPILILLLIIPIAILAVMFLRQFVNTEKRQSLIVLILSALDFVIWLVFKGKVSDFCSENYCSYETKAGFILSVLGCVAIAIISAGLYFEGIKDSGIEGINIGGKNCIYCGINNPIDNKFCVGCGKPFDDKTSSVESNNNIETIDNKVNTNNTKDNSAENNNENKEES